MAVAEASPAFYEVYADIGERHQLLAQGVSHARHISAGNALFRILGLLEDLTAPEKARSLVAAIAKHDHELVDAMVTAGGVKVNQTDHLGKTPLYFAVMYNDGVVVQYLLRKGVDPNLTESGMSLGGRVERDTPLNYAASHGYLDIVKLLVENGANIDANDIESATLNDKSDVADFLRDAVAKRGTKLAFSDSC